MLQKPFDIINCQVTYLNCHYELEVSNVYKNLLKMRYSKYSLYQKSFRVEDLPLSNLS